jgi:hypothetical protein
MKLRSAIKIDLFAFDHHRKKIDSVGDPLAEIDHMRFERFRRRERVTNIPDRTTVDVSWTKMHTKSRFAYKLPVGIDKKYKFIRKIETGTARSGQARAHFAITMMAGCFNPEPEVAGLFTNGDNRGLLTTVMGRISAIRGDSK